MAGGMAPFPNVLWLFILPEGIERMICSLVHLTILQISCSAGDVP